MGISPACCGGRLLPVTFISTKSLAFYFLLFFTCFLLFIPLFQKLYICGIILSMNLNLKMTVERSKSRLYFLSLVFITKCFTKNLLLSNSTVEKRQSKSKDNISK